ncbi:MAG: peptidoglycan-binding protein [Leptolyngbyaceae cyanobacterium CRU_2_3]|nr:peptidoglycan-binding protein [Leptolyngbyaceae cyanobacterium CRU_2_3]
MLTKVNLPNLIQGDQGAAVSLLQRLLVIYGYEQYLNPSGVDGVFGSGTSQAVQAFQGDHFLNKDGQVGQLTWKALSYPLAIPISKSGSATESKTRDKV